MFVLPLVINGGSQVRRAVIPAAGFNGGLFPATKAMKTNLFPIIDNGVAKPAILVNVEEAIDAGLEEVVIIVQPEDKAIYTRLFHEKLSPENFHRLSPEAQAYAKRILDIGIKVKVSQMHKHIYLRMRCECICVTRDTRVRTRTCVRVRARACACAAAGLL